MESSFALRQYNPNVIIQAAHDKLKQQNDLAGGQLLFQSALLDWVDDAREYSPQQHPELEQLREAIATLWLAYAHFLIQAKQYKSATEAYEQAVSCPIAGGVGRIWLDYARFCQERDKVRTAQNVYVRALVVGASTSNSSNGSTNGEQVGASSSTAAAAVTDEQDRAMLWGEFLDMMRTHNEDPNLTLEDLQEAVEREHAAAAAAAMDVSHGEPPTAEPEMVGSTATIEHTHSIIAPPPSKRPKLMSDTMNTTIATSTLLSQQQQQQQQPSALDHKTHVITPDAVDMETTALKEATKPGAMPPEITAAWMLRDGTDAATMPEPPLFTASPPKLSDASGRDILGDDLALALIQRLLERSGSLVLQVCQGLWMLSAMKEVESKRALEQFEQRCTADLERLDAKLDARHSVAGAAAHAVAQMNEQERSSFVQACQQQRQQLCQGIAWESRQLLWQQQALLAQVRVPGFEGGPTVDQTMLERHAAIASCLHSAFYLRTRVGEESHVKMLTSQLERFQQQQQQQGASGASPKQQQQHGSRTTTPTNRSPMTRSTGALTPPPMPYNMFPPNMQQQPPQLIPQAMYHANMVSQQQQSMVPPPYYNYMQQQQQQPPPPPIGGPPPPYPNFQYPPQQYY